MTGRRASWKGYLKLALVACPVKLFKATGSSSRTPCHFLHRDTKSRIQMIPHDPVLGRVSWDDLVTGYEYQKGRHVVLSDSELAEIELPSDRAITLESFVDETEVDPVYLDQPYFMVPDGAVAFEVFDLLREVMHQRRKVALVSLVLAKRERLAAFGVRGRGFLLTTLRSADEIFDCESLFAEIPIGEPSIELRNLTEQLVATRSRPFDPRQFKDRYRAALDELIELKIKDENAGPAAVRAARPTRRSTQESEPISLADAFRQSLDVTGKPPAKSRSRRARPLHDDRAKPAPADSSH